MSGDDNAQPLSPIKALALLSTLQSADIILPTTDGREIRLRRVTEPTAEQKSLLHQLGISIPERFEFARKCSADLSISGPAVRSRKDLGIERALTRQWHDQRQKRERSGRALQQRLFFAVGDRV